MTQWNLCTSVVIFILYIVEKLYICYIFAPDGLMGFLSNKLQTDRTTPIMLMNIKRLLILMPLICACLHIHADNKVNYIEQFGRLQLVGNQLTDENGDTIQLRGFNAFSPDYENCMKSKEDLDDLRGMRMNCIRVVRQISGEDIISDEQVKQWMEWTNEAGLYCIIDWNFMNRYNKKMTDSGDPNDYIDEAAKFFHAMAQEVANKQYKHILYEICNEPSHVNWETIKKYAEAIIDTITAIDTKKPIIIVGTPNWCQSINSQVAQSDNKITTDKANIMYSFHFYAGEVAHMNLESAEFHAATMAVPVFATEWNLGEVPELSTAESNNINLEGGILFLKDCLGLLNDRKQIVSWIYNAYGYGGNGAAMFKNGCGGELSSAGRFLCDRYGKCSEKTDMEAIQGEQPIIYPTIVEEGRFTVSTPGKATVSIYNVTGTLV